ncbi:hypothetical protein [Actinomadura sp. 3N508]|uniref:hypothetical protein n=1 Tax=Actinomadura sp. 3N508 TaxID=3375153 RepID=UPI0037A326E3
MNVLRGRVVRGGMGEHLYVLDKDADGYSVHAKLQRWTKINIGDIWDWRDFRTGCYDTTGIGSPDRHCNYSFGENRGIRVCVVRKKNGDRYGSWQCSPRTNS